MSETWEVDLVYLGGLVNQTNETDHPVLGLLQPGPPCAFGPCWGKGREELLVFEALGTDSVQ